MPRRALSLMHHMYGHPKQAPHLRQAHDVAVGSEDEDRMAQEVGSDTVNKLPRRQAVQELILPVADALEPVDTPLHDLLVDAPRPCLVGLQHSIIQLQRRGSEEQSTGSRAAN